MAEIVDIIGNGRVLCGVHQVDVNIRALFKIARHIEVEIAHDVHTLFGTIRSVSGRTQQATFLGTPVGINHAAVESVRA